MTLIIKKSKISSDNNKKVLSDALKSYKKTIKLQQQNYNKLFCKNLLKQRIQELSAKLLRNKKGPEITKVSVEVMFDFLKDELRDI